MRRSLSIEARFCLLAYGAQLALYSISGIARQHAIAATRHCSAWRHGQRNCWTRARPSKWCRVANAALIALMVVMLASAVAVAEHRRLHLYAMTGLALGLFGSLNFVAKELQREKAD